MAVVRVVPHYSTEAIVKPTLEEAVTVDTTSLCRKTAQSPEGNVDVEPSSSMDDSSMTMIEIGVDVEEGPRPNMMIGDGARSSVKPRCPVEPTTKMPASQLTRGRAIDPFADHTAELSMKAPMSVSKPADLG